MFKRVTSIGVLLLSFSACSDTTVLEPHAASRSPAASAVQGGGSAGSNPPGLPANGASRIPNGRTAALTGGVNGAPTFIWANRDPQFRSFLPPGTNAENAARIHLQRFAALSRLTSAETQTLELAGLHDTGRGAIVARFRRRIQGREVFGQQLTVAMDRELQPVSLSGHVTSGLPTAAKARAAMSPSSDLDVEHALIAALQDLTQVTLEPADLEPPTAAPGGYQTLSFARATAKLGATASDPARLKPVLYPKPAPAAVASVSPDSAEELLPAYYVEADLGRDSADEPRSFAWVISASDGSVLWKRDLTSHESFSYRVYADAGDLFMPWDGPEGTSATPKPDNEVDDYQAPFQDQNLVTLSSLTAVGVTDPWLPPGATSTLGNNVDAYLDLALPDGFTPGQDLRGSVSAPGAFDYRYDTGASADADPTQRESAVTQLFYDLNWFHDWYYAAGFTEAAGNAQASNYGRGGVEGDSIRAEGQDASGKNNANMSTPADGGRPRMRMYLWDYGTQSLEVSGASSAAGSYPVTAAAFSPNHFSATGSIVRADPPDACAPLAGSYTGSIVLIDRGGCDGGFALKAQNAQAAGAAAALIANVATSPTPETAPNIGGTPTVPISIGVLGLNLPDGDWLRASLSAGDALLGSVAHDGTLRDGDLDNQIVAHEWGHYISNRLIFDAAGLDTNMANGLGEGWADFHALLITVRAEDIDSPANANWSGVYSLGGYASGSMSSAPYYFGVRRYPYSTDLTKNPLTFKHISDAGLLPDDVPRAFDGAHNEPHNIGEVWATMLWECYAALLRDTLPPARLSFAGARDRMRDYLVAAYEITPASPTLLEARDALLAAALANDPTDHRRFAAAFAKRGAGVGASGPERFDATNSGIVESYQVGASVLATSATLLDDVLPVCNADGILDDGEVGTLRVVFENVGTAATRPLSAVVSTDTPGLSFPDGDTIQIARLGMQGTALGTLRVSAQHLSGITPLDFSVQVADAGAGLPAPFEQRFVGNADQLSNQSFTDDAESSHLVWTSASSDPSAVASSRWQRVASSPTDHYYHCPSAPSAGTADFISPPLYVLENGSFTLTFRQRFSFETDGASTYFDGGVIEISKDGGSSWQDVGAAVAGYSGSLALDSDSPLAGREAFVGTSPGYPDYMPVSLDFGQSLAGTEVLLRFRVASDAAGVSPGWDIDDLTVDGVANAPFDTLVPQPSICNNLPIAIVGEDQIIDESSGAPDFAPTVVTLDGSASIDPDGDPISYRWTQVSGSPVALSDPTSAEPTFQAPAVPTQPGSEVLGFQLVVNDGHAASAARISSVLVQNVNRPPIANAGPALSVDERSLVRLAGTASSDPDGDTLSYSWVAPAGIALSNANTGAPAFIAPEVDADTPLSFSLTVSDGTASSSPATVIVTVRNLDPAPVIH
jgi:hypothetical protein